MAGPESGDRVPDSPSGSRQPRWISLRGRVTRTLAERRRLRLLGHFLVGFLAAWASVVVLDELGAARDLQRVAAFLCVGGALAVVFSKEDLRPADSLGVIATVVGLAVSSAAALGVIGSIEEAPALGCVSSDGDLRATISNDAATVWSEATPASPATGVLLLKGCQMRFTGYCLGAIHRDAMEDQVTDSRWLILSDGRGLVAAGHTVGTIPEDEQPQPCPGSVQPPGPVSFTSAEIDPRTKRIQLLAQADRAAIIGFVIKNGDQWQRLGWDTKAMDEEPVVVAFPRGTQAASGATVAAVACIGFERPSGQLAARPLATGVVPAGQEPSNAQPESDTADETACAASVPPPA
jgi:hypothetical protein